MTADVSSKSSGRPAHRKDGRDLTVISAEEMKKYVKIAGKPWHHRKKKISLKRVKALRSAGFSIRQIAKIYHTSDSTVRRRTKGESKP